MRAKLGGKGGIRESPLFFLESERGENRPHGDPPYLGVLPRSIFGCRSRQVYMAFPASSAGPNGCNQRLATMSEPRRPILSRVRWIALLGDSAEYMGSKRNVNHAKAVPVNAAEPPDEKVMSLAEGANVLLVGVWVVIGYESLKGGRIRWM